MCILVPRDDYFGNLIYITHIYIMIYVNFNIIWCKFFGVFEYSLECSTACNSMWTAATLVSVVGGRAEPYGQR